MRAVLLGVGRAGLGDGVQGSERGVDGRCGVLLD